MSQSAEMLMDGLGSCFPDESVFSLAVTPSLIFQCVYGAASQLLTSSDWRARRSALTAMLVIMEYTYDYFKPVLQPLALQVHALLHDPVPAVRRKAAFFFSEAVDYCEAVLLEAAPFLLEDIQEVWAARAREA